MNGLNGSRELKLYLRAPPPPSFLEEQDMNKQTGDSSVLHKSRDASEGSGLTIQCVVSPGISWEPRLASQSAQRC